MTKERYVRMTGAVRRAVSRLPGKERFLLLPTAVCAAAYVCALLSLLLARDARFLRASAVPAACFLAATVLRDAIGKERPYDRYGVPPVGRYRPGKRRSLPSRHAASAAAIAFAFAYVFPGPAAFVFSCALLAAIGALRVLTGHHDAVDVAAGIALSAVISAAGYLLL